MLKFRYGLWLGEGVRSPLPVKLIGTALLDTESPPLNGIILYSSSISLSFSNTTAKLIFAFPVTSNCYAYRSGGEEKRMAWTFFRPEPGQNEIICRNGICTDISLYIRHIIQKMK